MRAPDTAAASGPRACVFALEAIGTHWKIETCEPLGARWPPRILERIRRFEAGQVQVATPYAYAW